MKKDSLHTGNNQNKRRIIFLSVPFIVTLLYSCVSEFIPAFTDYRYILVVEGLITDRQETDTVRLSRATPLRSRVKISPLNGCLVSISDNLGNVFSLTNIGGGKYITDSSDFRGIIGRSYQLHIASHTGPGAIHYESNPSELKPVPPIDSLYYEKTIIQPPTFKDPRIDGCQIYISTHDPENMCKYYRWDFQETWVIWILWPVPNNTCWITENSKTINIRSTDAMTEAVIERYPIYFISNVTDRLRCRYTIDVNQYSLNADEFTFWEKLRNITDQTGGLYDIIPSSVPGNIYCVDNPGETVLGYFSVSGKSSKRIYIQRYFSGVHNPYQSCASDTVPTDNPDAIVGIYQSVWPIMVQRSTWSTPGFTILSKDKNCYDCTTRGTNIKPVFWTDK